MLINKSEQEGHVLFKSDKRNHGSRFHSKNMEGLNPQNKLEFANCGKNQLFYVFT